MRLDVLTEASMMMTVFRDAEQCSLLEVYDVSGLFAVSIIRAVKAPRASRTSLRAATSHNTVQLPVHTIKLTF
jgi:hypothetical protein